MTFPEIKLVDAPTATATVLFDFNDITATPKREVTADDFTIGAPQLQGDVDAVDPLYSDRVVSFTCAITGTKPQVAAAQSALARRLLTPGQGWLMVRMTATSRLLFFRTYRPQPGDLSFELVQTVSATKSERWELEVNLPCEPFAYGERITQVAQTVSSDPTSGSNPLRVVLPAIVGDSAAPLDITLSTNVAYIGPRNALTVMSHAAPSERATVSMPIGTGDGATAQVDTSAPVAQSLYAGGSARTVSFATDPGYTVRLELPIGAGLVPGRYRALIRAMASTSGSTFQVGFTGFERPSIPATFQPDGSTRPTWLDMGIISTSVNMPESPNIPPETVPTSLRIFASRTAGTASLNLDHILLVPVDVADTVESRMMRVTSEGQMNAGSLYIDGTYDEVVPRNSGAVGAVGSFIRGIPGASNVLNFTFSSSPFTTDVITRPVTVNVSYYPRFLYLGDS